MSLFSSYIGVLLRQFKTKVTLLWNKLFKFHSHLHQKSIMYLNLMGRDDKGHVDVMTYDTRVNTY